MEHYIIWMTIINYYKNMNFQTRVLIMVKALMIYRKLIFNAVEIVFEKKIVDVI